MTAMPKHDWLRRLKALVNDMLRLADESRDELGRLDQHRLESERVALEDFRSQTRANLIETRARRAMARRNHTLRRHLVETAIQERRVAVKNEGTALRKTTSHKPIVLTVADDVEEKAQEDLQESLWSATALYEGAEAGAVSSYKASSTRIDDATELIVRIRAIRDWKISCYPAVRRLVNKTASEEPRLTGGDLNERLTEAQRLLDQFGRHEPSRSAYWPVAVGPVVLGASLPYPAFQMLGILPAVLITLLGIALSAIVLTLRTRGKAARPLAADILELDRTLIEAEAALELKAKRIKRRLRHQQKLNKRRRDEQERVARKTFSKIVKPRIESLDSKELNTVDRLEKRLVNLNRCRKNVPRWVEKQLVSRLESIRVRHREKRMRAREDYRSVLELIAENHRHQVERVDPSGEEGCSKIRAAVAGLEHECAGTSLPWDSTEWSSWIPPTAVPRGIRIGGLELPGDLRRDPSRPIASIPVVIPFNTPAHLVLVPQSRADRPGLIEALNTLMLRFVTSIPPGKLLLTILDPVGRGASFSNYLSLAEQSETLVSYPIWTDPDPIHARLSELQESLGAGEFPHRLLVIADFPTGFDDAAIERLMQILESGPGSRVFTLIGVDPSADFETSFLEPLAVVSTIRKGRLQNPLPIALDPPADPELMARLLTVVGRAAADASSPLMRVLT